jgi:hypothetical protein
MHLFPSLVSTPAAHGDGWSRMCLKWLERERERGRLVCLFMEGRVAELALHSGVRLCSLLSLSRAVVCANAMQASFSFLLSRQAGRLCFSGAGIDRASPFTHNCPSMQKCSLHSFCFLLTAVCSGSYS